jgi:hypothetical protein
MNWQNRWVIRQRPNDSLLTNVVVVSVHSSSTGVDIEIARAVAVLVS